MRLIFLGLLFNETSLKQAYRDSKRGVQMAPHLFQSRLIHGLYEIDNVKTYVIHVPPIGSYPMNYKNALIPSIREGRNYQIGYINFPLIKHAEQEYKIRKKIEEVISSDNCKTVIVVYSLYQPFINAAIKIKKKNPEIKLCLIQPDAVPGRNDAKEYMSRQRVRLGNKLVREVHSFDSFVVLSSQVVEPLEVGNRPYTVIECICDSSQKQNITKEESENVFLYTGSTSEVSGLKSFVEAIKNIPEASLWICGTGDGDEYIRETAKTNTNIVYYGYLNQEEIFKLRDRCDFLVNPRIPSGTYTKYSFPSKTSEYMLSGKPTVMYKLEGVPDEYDRFLNYLHANDVVSLEKEIRYLLHSDYNGLVQKALHAREFMINTKSEYVQARKLVNLLANV